MQGWLEDGRLRVLPSEMRRRAREGPQLLTSSHLKVPGSPLLRSGTLVVNMKTVRR